ncbi:hypothetical protein CRYUN_Cryun27aG0014900 [Craigia yunnanensis]
MPIQKNIYRKKFGFVHFQEGYQAVNAVKWLNGAWLLDQKIRVKHVRVEAIDQKWHEFKQHEA